MSRKASARELTHERDAEREVIHVVFGEGRYPSAPRDTPGAAQLCACQEKVAGAPSCADLIGGPDDDCARTYADDCSKLLGCVRGEPSAPSKCLAGWRHATALGRCFKQCEGSGCEVGFCRTYAGAGLCM